MGMAATIHRWTLAELHRLPDDGNKYELIHGELFVTPAPTDAHEELAALLSELLTPYVSRNRLGRVYHPRAVVQYRGSEVEPDLMVRPIPARLPVRWDRAPRAHLVVEIVSPFTRRRDYTTKREFYLERRIPEYWVVDGEERTILVVRPGMKGVRQRARIDWQPAGAPEPFVLDVAEYFREALGEE
jgi:Uma2 family endonuclease